MDHVIFLSSLFRWKVSALPLYEYKCAKCGHRFEKIEPVSASESKKCPKCGAKAQRLLSAPAIQFKGSGWYVTDYAGKKKDGAAAEKSSDGDSSKTSKEASGDSKSADSSKSTEKETPKKKK